MSRSVDVHLGASRADGAARDAGRDPPEVGAVDVTVVALGADGVEVAAGGGSSVLIASDADGTLMLAAANEDGGYLDEGPGAVELGIESTAITLVAVASGRRFGEIDRELAETIRSHHDFGRLTRLLAALMASDKNYLERLYNYPQAVTLIKSVAAGVASVGAEPSAATGPRVKRCRKEIRCRWRFPKGTPPRSTRTQDRSLRFTRRTFIACLGAKTRSDSSPAAPGTPTNRGTGLATPLA